MKIYFEEGQAVTQEILDTMMQAAEYCLDAEQIDTERSEISVTFVSLEEIHELNREYRQVDSPTDVLSFPQFDDLDELPEEGEIMLGDVVICLCTACSICWVTIIWRKMRNGSCAAGKRRSWNGSD